MVFFGYTFRVVALDMKSVTRNKSVMLVGAFYRLVGSWRNDYAPAS